MDGLGRTTKETDPNGNITYTVYDDVDHEERIYAGWNSSSGTPTGPTEVMRYDTAGNYEETLTMSATPHLTSGVPDGTEAIGSVQSLSRTFFNSGGQVSEEDDYFNLSGLTYSTSTSLGTSGTNYYATPLRLRCRRQRGSRAVSDGHHRPHGVRWARARGQHLGRHRRYAVVR